MKCTHRFPLFDRFECVPGLFLAQKWLFLVHGGRSWWGSNPKGGGGGAPQTPKLSHGTMCFVGARGAGDFLLGIRQGDFFCSTLCVSTQNTQNFVENSKMAKKHNVATLPTSWPLLILSPSLKRRGSPRRQGLCSHLAHKWATSDSAPRSASSGSSALSGTSDYVPSESMFDGPAACRVTRSQAARPKKRARPKSTGKRARDGWEDDSDA